MRRIFKRFDCLSNSACWVVPSSKTFFGPLSKSPLEQCNKYIYYPDLLGGKTSLSSSNTQAISTTFKSSPSHVVVFDAHIQRIIVLATEETTVTQPVINHIDLSTANPARGHKEVRRSQQVTSWSQPAAQTNRDPNRDKTLARPNQPRTSETYRRHDDVFGHELQI